METRKLLAILIVVIVLSMTVLVAFYPATGNFSADNPFWNGLTTFDKQFNGVTVESFNSLPSEPKGTAFIVIPYEPFTQSQLNDLSNYVSLGGTLIIMDNYGFGNQILSYLGLNLRFTGEPLLDPLFNYKNGWFPEITNFSAAPVTSDVSSIVLNHATSLSNTSGATVIAYSSDFSFLSLNDNSVWNANDPSGPLPVAAYVKIGEGYMIAVANPSILINSMIGMNNNLQFITNVVDFQSSSPQVLIDQSHLPKTSLDEAKASIFSVYAVVASPLGTLSLIAVIFALSLKSVWRKGGQLDRKR
jgi:hypothetical protein